MAFALAQIGISTQHGSANENTSPKALHQFNSDGGCESKKHHMEKYYQSPFSGEQWTKEEHDAYVQWEETRIAENKKNDCEDCYGCEKCESM